ncbi:MAG TPA: hypothetical protein VLJ86_24665, partial [Ramlibacter sp.]|nr:hypothetical protein [Ramlibacter sp.]
MNRPTPAIVAQAAVRRLPRVALILLCIAYVLPGFVGREPWKAQDMTAFGYMFELARGATSWLAPTLLNQPPEFDGLLPYWLGAGFIRAFAGWLPADVAARLPFAGLLALTLAATWWGIYHLARRPQAQPLAFAFGGEADPTDYARAMADAGLLALIASLGMAQLSHETTPALAQLGFAALAFHGLAALPRAGSLGVLSAAAGLLGLGLSGAPSTALLLALGGAALLFLDRPAKDDNAFAPRHGEPVAAQTCRGWPWGLALLVVACVVVALASGLSLWRWRVSVAEHDWRAQGRLLLWFTWPAWPLAMWTLWRWRWQLSSHHIALPLWFLAVTTVAALAGTHADRSLLLGLPALAALAAFALPTLRRVVSAFIDWFTLLFFSGCALVIWVVWISLQTGFPAKPAANVAKLAPGFTPSFSLFAFVVALAGTLAWAALVRWRAGRHQEALWKSLVLPAGGAVLCWLLLMTLWLPVLDYARSYVPAVRGVTRALTQPGCVEVAGLNRGQIAALRFHGGLTLREAQAKPQCPWRVLPADLPPELAATLRMDAWKQVATVRR